MMQRTTVVFVALVAIVLAAAQCSQPEATKVPADTPAATAALPATEAPVATEAPTATEAPAATEPPAATEAPAGADGLSLLQARCTKCHDLARVESAKKSQDQWVATVQRMVSKGAQLSSAEQETLVKYLAATYK
jgi:hypothetical protein